jgi:hypothetical protein
MKKPGSKKSRDTVPLSIAASSPVFLSLGQISGPMWTIFISFIEQELGLLLAQHNVTAVLLPSYWSIVPYAAFLLFSFFWMKLLQNKK